MVQNLLYIWRTIETPTTTESAAYESSPHTRHKGNPTDFIFKSFNKECHISYDSMLGVLHELAKAGNLPSPELIRWHSCRKSRADQEYVATDGDRI